MSDPLLTVTGLERHAYLERLPREAHVEREARLDIALDAEGSQSAACLYGEFGMDRADDIGCGGIDRREAGTRIADVMVGYQQAIGG